MKKINQGLLFSLTQTIEITEFYRGFNIKASLKTPQVLDMRQLLQDAMASSCYPGEIILMKQGNSEVSFEHTHCTEVNTGVFKF